jgi:hypothetical protein
MEVSKRPKSGRLASYVQQRIVVKSFDQHKSSGRMTSPIEHPRQFVHTLANGFFRRYWLST